MHNLYRHISNIHRNLRVSMKNSIILLPCIFITTFFFVTTYQSLQQNYSPMENACINVFKCARNF